MKKLIPAICLLLCVETLLAQSVTPIATDLTVDSILETKPSATKIAYDPVSGNLFYSTISGDIYEVIIPGTGPATDTLRFQASDHGITAVQGLSFRDSVMFLSGNIWSSTTGVGKIVKGVLQPTGSRMWVDVVTTEAYPTASSGGDHGFTGVDVDPDGNYIYVSSGARTHLGEVRTNNGAWPGYREGPLTTKLYRFPINTVGVTLQNDTNYIENSGYIFAWGTRNAYSMAWDANNELFAIDNSGERDDPEELNWIRQGKHYGYPWRMGGNENPLQNSPYNADNDPLVNPQSGGYQQGWFNDDPNFPPPPNGVTFTEPIRNYGTAADNYKDAVTGKVKDASDEGTYITSFTAHRSPLGLVIDRDSALAEPFRGNAFVLSFMPGGDSTGYTPLSPWGSPCPFVDTSRELVQLNLSYNSGIDNYSMTTANLATGFYLPVDAELVGNKLYVIENGGDIWRVNFPGYNNVPEVNDQAWLQVYPNPFTESTSIQFNTLNVSNLKVVVYNAMGQIVLSEEKITTNKLTLKTIGWGKGVYFLKVSNREKVVATEKLVVE